METRRTKHFLLPVGQALGPCRTTVSRHQNFIPKFIGGPEPRKASHGLGSPSSTVGSAEDVRRQFVQLRRFSTRLPRMELVLTGLLGLGVAFILGVFVPLVEPTSPNELWLWTPMIFTCSG
jgi:hypothetical protein